MFEEKVRVHYNKRSVIIIIIINNIIIIISGTIKCFFSFIGSGIWRYGLD
jgi:hypothetical protein